MGLAPASSAERQFGKYSLVAKLATGGMAEIFLARLKGAAGFEKLVCVKRILPALAKDKQFVSMFLAEAKIAAQISHPNVCQVFELGEIDGRYYIAMEYLEGVPLTCFRRRDLYVDNPGPRLLAGLGVQACEGLHHAHQLKKPDGTLLDVVHRDISGNNLFATVDGVVKVLDFGIAKVNQHDTAVKTSTGSVKGTYAYMAPEQLRGERLDRRTDVFAMGIVMWELACRQHLFRRDTEFLTFQAITADPIPDMRTYAPQMPEAFAEAVAKALSRKPGDRYPTARAFGEALAESVAPLGGALVAAALSEEVERGFAVRLEEQRALIKTAREGGGYDLASDLGPGVGYGTEMLSTPLSIASGLNQGEPRSKTVQVMPLGLRRKRSLLPWLVGVPLAVAAAAIAFLLVRGKPDAVAHADAAQVAAISAPADAAAAPSAPDASVPLPDAALPIDAAVPLDAGPPPDAAPKKPPKPDPITHARPAGAPGFITIDSAPYATIYIDGKSYGVTPVVHVSLASGRHAVRAVGSNGKVQMVTITIESGKTAPARQIRW
jgi:serine/threonine-protein kinase